MKYPVYGMEKPYLMQLQKELLVYTDDTFFDRFSNLIAEKRQDKTIVVGVPVSENAFLVNELCSDGKVKFSPLYEIPQTLSNERVVSLGGKPGLIDAKEQTLDFGAGGEKNASRIVKKGDVLYLKASFESLGDFYITNEITYFLKCIMADFVKQSAAKLTVAFLREQKKGAHALGKNYPADEAYFLTCCEELPGEVCFLKKEGDFVSPMEIPALCTAVKPDMVTLSNAYFLSSGCPRVAGLALRMKKLPGGQYQIKKEAVKQLYAFLESLV